MSPKSRVFDELLCFASTPRSRSAVVLAAVTFAVCHLIVMSTSPAAAGAIADPQSEIPRQLIHFAAELCRFTLPLGVMIGGMIRRQSGR